MPIKKSVKKTPSKKEIESTAASVEAAIEKLDAGKREEEAETVGITEVNNDNPIVVNENSPKSEEKANKEEDVMESDKHEPETEVKTEEVSKTISDSSIVTEEELPEEKVPADFSSSRLNRSSLMEEEKGGGSKSKVIIVICLCIIFTVLGFFGGYLYAKNVLGVNSAPVKLEEVATESSPTPTKQAEVNLSEYSIEVLNGSGVAGVAGTEQDALEVDGFSVENTGNAEDQDFTQTEIAVKSSVPKDFIEKLKDSLSERYVVASSTEVLEADNTYDVVVTIGSETVVDE